MKFLKTKSFLHISMEAKRTTGRFSAMNTVGIALSSSQYLERSLLAAIFDLPSTMNFTTYTYVFAIFNCTSTIVHFAESKRGFIMVTQKVNIFRLK